MVDVAEITIWGELAGAVRWDETMQLASFQYGNDFLAKNLDLSPIKMPVSNGNRIYSFPELLRSGNTVENAFNGLPGLLSDSLPDKYGNSLIDSWLSQQGRSPQSMNPVEKLCFIGARGMGALEFRPAIFKRSKNTFAIEVDSLVQLSNQILNQRESFYTNLSNNEKEAMKHIIKVGTSAGGMRAKAIVAYNEKTGEVRSGQTRVPKGFEHWLLKLDGVNENQLGVPKGYGRIEMAYYLMALDCEITMMKSRLLEENERAHFMTMRFDREGSDIKHHIQTFCGIQHFDYNDVVSYSYEQLFQTMRMLRLDYSQAKQMFRRMVFNVAANNCDDHTKNFAFRLRQNGAWELAPAYDVSYSYDPKSIWVSQHALSINGKRKNISKDDLVVVGKQMNIKKSESIIKQISEVVNKWPDYADETKVSNSQRDTISSTLMLL
ncbi:MAG: type II toxin-antitoxin system HipA family toxin [Bacteroidetes bacterium]|nr:type II toxin-antitoxin system HipA family toxin [Bacteroidota bacterium]MBL6943229.1 type II toxin-antitoxin system HipA family toxin [Bacteroidales bacterium]